MEPDYRKLQAVLTQAYEQSAVGKGRERHANGKDFDRQPILEIGRMVGPGFQLGQVQKKAQEAAGMIGRANLEGARQELLGAIVYAAAAVVQVDEMLAQLRDRDAVKTQPTPPVTVHPPRPTDTRLTQAMRAVDVAVNEAPRS